MGENRQSSSIEERSETVRKNKEETVEEIIGNSEEDIKYLGSCLL